MTERYQRLLELTRTQRTLIDAGDWSGAVSLGAEWQELVDGLPDRAPDAVRPLLEEAASIAWSNTAAIEALAAEVSRELAHLGRGRRALASYASA
ncbi:MAG: hypothetical protein JWM06_3000 [Actinomycetia bacterium]|jgi:hypothetical protein|nr:hypothetical protein [Actinomycetes bacterium]